MIVSAAVSALVGLVVGPRLGLLGLALCSTVAAASGAAAVTVFSGSVVLPVVVAAAFQLMAFVGMALRHAGTGGRPHPPLGGAACAGPIVGH